MSLSSNTHKTLVVALASKPAALELEAAVLARSSSLSPDLQRRIIDCHGRTAGKEIIASIASGAALSLNTRRRMLVAMAGDATPSGGMEAAGNELINFIQSAPNAKKTVL
jgi:hypothetical protein